MPAERVGQGEVGFSARPRYQAALGFGCRKPLAGTGCLLCMNGLGKQSSCYVNLLFSVLHCKSRSPQEAIEG